MTNDDFEPATFDGKGNKHHTARALAEAALRAEDDGDFDRADSLMDQAERADPGAVETVLREADRPRARRPSTSTTDEDVAAITRTIEPEGSAPPPSRLDEDY